MPVSTGETAPDFTLVGDDFKNHTLSSYRGKKVVLAFYPNAFSGASDGGCEFQLCQLKPLTESGAVVLGISHDWPFQTKAFKEKIELTYPLLSDPDRGVIEKYVGTFDKGAFFDKAGLFDKGHPPMPAGNRGCVVIDEEGKILWAFVSKDEDGNSHPGIIPPVAEIKKHIGA